MARWAFGFSPKMSLHSGPCLAAAAAAAGCNTKPVFQYYYLSVMVEHGVFNGGRSGN